MELWTQKEIEELRENFFGKASETGKKIRHDIPGKECSVMEFPDGSCEIFSDEDLGRHKFLGNPEVLKRKI